MNHWSSVKLGDATSKVGSGATPKGGQESYQSTGVPLIRSMNVRFEGFDRDGLAFLSSEQARALDGVVVEPGDVLLNITGASIGRVTLAPPELAGARVNQHVCIIRTRPGLEAQFVGYFLRAPAMQRMIMAEQYGATRQALTKSMILDFDVPVPPLNEQRRIVAKLDSLLARSRRAKEALETVPALLERFRQSVLASAFRGDLTKDWREKNPDVEPASKLLERIRIERRRRWEETELEKMQAKGKVPKDDKWKAKYEEPEPVDTTGLPELPEGWAWATWQMVGDSQNGRPFPSADYASHGEKLLRPGNLHVSGEVRWTDENTKYMPLRYAKENEAWVVGPNELVMNLTAQSLKDEFLGRVCLTGPGERCLLNQRIARLSPHIISPRFVLWLMKSPQFRRFVDGLNSGTLIQHMFTSQLDEWPFALPPLQEQSVIIDCIEHHAAAWKCVAESASEAQKDIPRLEASLLAKAFRGELVPQDPADEPASVLLERIRAERDREDKSPPTKASKKARAAKVA